MSKKQREKESSIWFECDLSKCLFDLRMRIAETKCAYFGCEVTTKDLTLLN